MPDFYLRPSADILKLFRFTGFIQKQLTGILQMPKYYFFTTLSILKSIKGHKARYEFRKN